jgi:hypothetical protein
MDEILNKVFDKLRNYKEQVILQTNLNYCAWWLKSTGNLRTFAKMIFCNMFL